MGPTEQQMGGDTGDIIISSAPDKPKVSRPLMLGIIIGVLVLVGGAVAAVVLLSQQKGGGSTAQVVTKVNETTLVTADDYKDSFLLYANYILTGVASTDPLPAEYDPDVDYPIWQAMGNNNKEFINIASGYLDNFETQYEDAIDPLSNTTNTINDEDYVIDEYFGYFETVKNHIDGKTNISGMSEEEIGDYYDALSYAKGHVLADVWGIWSALNA